MMHNKWLKMICAVALGIAVGPSLVDPPWISGFAHAADAVPAEEILRSLKKGKTRSLEKKDPAVEARVLELKKIGKTRGLTLSERQDLTNITHDNPQIDLTIYFALDSAEISAEAKPQIDELGKALASGLTGQSFTLGGHSDGRGTAEYNLSLSKRRAEAVQRYLVERFKINPDALLAVGFGFEQLKNPENPMADENRRVQLVNMSR